MKNNLEKLKEILISDDQNTVIVNQVNDEIKNFYDLVIREFSKELDIKIIYDDKYTVTSSSDNLFKVREVFLFSITDMRKIKEICKQSFKKIIFTDYKSFKGIQKDYISINGYNYADDIRYFLKSNNVLDEKLISYCILQPYFIFSELSKYNINKSDYSIDKIENDSFNFILKIRKDVFKIKNNRTKIKELYHKLKEEVKYKKFSFLTY